MRSLVMVGMLCGAACSKQSGDAPPRAGSAAPKVAVSHVAAPKVAQRERWAVSFVVGAAIKDGVVTFDQDRGTLEGLTKTPIELVGVAVAPDRIAFTIKKPTPEATWEKYELVRTGDAARGKGSVGTFVIPTKLVRLADGESPRSAYPRPQTPKPPFPYDAHEVTIDAPDGGKLAGTLTLPKATGRAPAVLLWSGSGQQDRDETIYNHKPYLILSDRLTRAGFAVLRLDDRATGKTMGALGTLHTEIDDAGAAIDFLKAQNEIDPKRVGMIGHSTGGMVVPNVALAHPLAFAVSLAGVAVPGRDLVILQHEATSNVTGVPLVAAAEAMQKKIGDASLKGADEVKRVFVEIVTPQLQAALGRAPTQEEITSAIAQPLAEATAPWTLSFFTIDPREAWKKLTMPVLLVVGDHDTQVPADPTIAALTGAHGKPGLLTTKKLPGLNHLFQHAKTGLPDEYVDIEESFDPATLDIIASWLAAQTKL